MGKGEALVCQKDSEKKRECPLDETVMITSHPAYKNNYATHSKLILKTQKANPF